MRRVACALLGATGLLCVEAARAEEPDKPSDSAAFSLSYVADLMGVVDGGRALRGRFVDNLDLVADLDLEQLISWRGVSAHIDVLNNSGGTPNDDAGTLQGIDNVEVSWQRLRLFETWVEKAWGSSTLRAGLYDLNSEFYANDSAGLLIAPAFGVGSELAATGPNGPSIFPSTALAARFHAWFDNGFYMRAAILNAHAGVLGDPGGVNTSFDDGGLIIAESGMEGSRKLAFGAWRYTHAQDDIRDVDGLGDPIQRTAQGAYLVYEQPLNRGEGARATTAFLRAGVSDGETTSFQGGWQAGILVERAFDGRPDSVFSAGVNQAVLSDGYRQNQIDLGLPMERTELQLEVTYADKVLPFLILQPDLQWVRRPGGDRSIPDALVAGIRASVEL